MCFLEPCPGLIVRKPLWHTGFRGNHLVVGFYGIPFLPRLPWARFQTGRGDHDTQMPPEHTGVPPEQTLPQTPQLLGSVWLLLSQPLARSRSQSL